MFGAVFPCIRLEAKHLDGPQNGVLEVELCSTAVSTALSRAAQELTQQPGFREKPLKGGEEESKEKRKPCRHGPGLSGLFCMGSSPLFIN